MATKIKVSNTDEFFAKKFSNPFDVLLDGGVWRFEGNGAEYRKHAYFVVEVRKWANLRGKSIKWKLIDRGTKQEAIAVCMVDPTEDQKKRTKQLREFYHLEEDKTVDDDDTPSWEVQGEDNHIQ